MRTDADVIVVGSGPAGAQAAQTLVEAGAQVLLVDAGRTATSPAPPPRPFQELRGSDPTQHSYFLGDDFCGVPLARLGAAPQVTPPRRHVLDLLPGFSATLAKGFAALESHALGGLGAAWGAVSFPFLPDELRRAGFEPGTMARHYERVARRVGVNGDHDDLKPWRGELGSMQPPLEIDHNAAGLLAAYARQRTTFHKHRIRVGRPLLAVLSRDLGARRSHALGDMDFWSNSGDSTYRPEITVRELAAHSSFHYASGWLVERFREPAPGSVQLLARNADSGEARTFTARQVILAAGALGTTRIVLQSFPSLARAVPLVCNAHLYVPCIHLRHLGRPHRDSCHSLAQLSMIHDPTGDASSLVQAQMYSYRSLLLFRLLKESPLATRESLWAMRALAPSLVVWAVEEQDEPDASRFCRLLAHADGSTGLEVIAPESVALERQRRQHEQALLWGMRRLGCWPLRRVHSGPGSSLHYGGQFPASAREEPFTTDATGRLHGTERVYVADGAAFRYLPAKGLTLTLMANADRVAAGIVERGN